MTPASAQASDPRDPDGQREAGGGHRFGLVARLLFTVAALVLCWLLLRRLDLRQVLAVVGRANWLLLSLAVVLNLTVNLLARTLRWWALLSPIKVAPVKEDMGKLHLWELGLLLCASYAASNLLPARAGEALRPVYLRKRHGYSTGSVVAGQVVEKLIEAVSLGFFGLLVAIFAAPPQAIRLSLFGFAAVGPLGLFLCIYGGRRMAAKGMLPPESALPASPSMSGGRRFLAALRIRGRRFLYRLGEGMGAMGSPAVLLRSLWWSTVSDLTDVGMLGLCLLSVGAHLPLSAWVLTFLGINLAIAIPSTPGQVGVLEAGAVLILHQLGVPSGEALAFALLYHAAHIVPLTILGVFSLRFVLRFTQWGSQKVDSP